MNIETLTLGALSTNCYLVYDPDSREALVIDPADEAIFIAEKIHRLNLKLKAIVATHGHFDHVLAASELQLIYPNAPFYIHQKDLFLLKNMNNSASHWLKNQEKRLLPQTIRFLDEKNFRLSTGACPEYLRGNFRFIHTPGHTPGSLCIYLKGSKLPIFNDQFSNVLFSGDTLFKSAVGRTDFSYSDPHTLSRSLNKLFKLPQDSRVYPGHGEMTTIKNETWSLKPEAF